MSTNQKQPTTKMVHLTKIQEEATYHDVALPRIETNVEFIQRITENDPIVQIFIIDALTKQADAIIENEAAIREAMKTHFFSGEEWVSVAKYVKSELDKKYTPSKLK